MVSIVNTGTFNGVAPPKIFTGQLMLPTGMILTGGTYTTAVNDRFYFPYYCHYTKTFTGMKTYNAGAGDNAETLRLGIYNDDGASGGPGTLVIDAGEITLSAAAALRTLATSFSLTGGKWYWMCYAANTAAAMFAMSPMLQVTAAGHLPAYPLASAVGNKLSSAPSVTAIVNSGRGFYVSTAYGALPATATAPTAELNNVYEAGSGGNVNNAPLIGIYA